MGLKYGRKVTAREEDVVPRALRWHSRIRWQEGEGKRSWAVKEHPETEPRLREAKGGESSSGRPRSLMQSALL